MNVTELVSVDDLSDEEVQRRWEEAYLRFETPAQEIAKFVGRLKSLGQERWDRNSQIVDIFCGRGNGLKALESLGFNNIEGVDISPDLVAEYSGPAKMHVADCRELPFESSSRDIVIVQGGLHHLPELPSDLQRTLSEVRRVLRPNGNFIMVEPWVTPFLRAVHFASERVLVRRVSSKFDSFATMTHYEAKTYFNWLESASEIKLLLRENFEPTISRIRFGKFFFAGRKP